MDTQPMQTFYHVPLVSISTGFHFSEKQMAIKIQIYQPHGELPGYDQVPLCGPVCLWRATDLHEDKISATFQVKKFNYD